MKHGTLRLTMEPGSDYEADGAKLAEVLHAQNLPVTVAVYSDGHIDVLGPVLVLAMLAKMMAGAGVPVLDEDS